MAEHSQARHVHKNIIAAANSFSVIAEAPDGVMRRVNAICMIHNRAFVSFPETREMRCTAESCGRAVYGHGSGYWINKATGKRMVV